MDAVTLRHVDKAYTSYSTEIVITGEQRQSRTRQVLKDLSVTFAAGQLTVIVGRSGCGKSTLLKLLAGKEQPDAGEISIPQGWHSAMLSPDPYVITWTNVQRNVAMACGVGKTPEERYEKAADFVRLVGLEDYADLTPMELSTGMKQRLGLARILASQAQLLLMDEPFASLDFLTRGELQSQLLAIQKKLPRTIVLVTHQLEEALLLGQKIVVMHPDSTLPPISPHVYRHTFCTELAAAGIEAKSLQYLMGHATISTTLDTYTHINYERAAEQMAQAVSREKSPEKGLA